MTQWYREIVLDRDKPSALSRDLVAFRDGGQGIGYDTDDLGDRVIVLTIVTLHWNSVQKRWHLFQFGRFLSFLMRVC